METSLLFLSLIMFAVLCLFTLITLVKKRKSFLFVFIPLVLFLTGSVAYTYTELMGYPTTKELPSKFLVVKHFIDEPDAIYLWVLTPGIKEPIGYELPYSKELHRLISKMMQKAEQSPEGTQMRGTNSQGDNHMIIEFQLYNFVDQERQNKLDSVSD
jgi:hypothetical protein